MPSVAPSSEMVVMLHGRVGTPRSMLAAGWFKKAGYRVASMPYRSRKIGVEAAVRDLAAPALEKITSQVGVEKRHHGG